MQRITELQKAIHYQFNEIRLLKLAITHSSYAHEYTLTGQQYNERLEFLGDAVLGLVISEYLYKHYPELPEGRLTKLRALIVCEPSLAAIARQIKLGDYLQLGKGEAASGGRMRPSILADALEALIAAIYLDGGQQAAVDFIMERFTKKIADALAGKLFSDYKTALQERVQASGDLKVHYQIIDQSGPDHHKIFTAAVYIGDSICGKGKGKSKKEAEQLAAMQALQVYNLEVARDT